MLRESIKVPFLQLRIWENSVLSKIKRAECWEKSLGDGREQWTRLPQPSIMIQKASNWMMAGDCLRASFDMLPSPISDGDGLLSFGVPQGGACDIPHRLRDVYFEIPIHPILYYISELPWICFSLSIAPQFRAKYFLWCQE